MNRLLCSALLVLSLGSVTHGHDWTDATGHKKAQATYVSSDAQYVYVRLADARSARVERGRLSDGDRLYVAQLEQRPVGGAMPATAPTEQLPSGTDPSKIRFVYRGCGTAQHLAGAKGTAVYYGKGGLIVAALKYDHDDRSYYYYRVDEPGCEKEMWRFARVCYDCCGYRVERYLQVKPGTYDWVCWYCAERYSAVAPDCK